MSIVRHTKSGVVIDVTNRGKNLTLIFTNALCAGQPWTCHVPEEIVGKPLTMNYGFVDLDEMMEYAGRFEDGSVSHRNEELIDMIYMIKEAQWDLEDQMEFMGV